MKPENPVCSFMTKFEGIYQHVRKHQYDPDAPWRCQLIFGSEADADCIAVCDQLPHGYRTTLPRERRILLVSEPPNVARYPARYVNQFAVLVSPFQVKGFRGRHVRSHPALPWHFGWKRAVDPGVDENHADWFMSFREIRGIPIPEKTRALSAVTSTKHFTREHRRRLDFVSRFGAVAGGRLDVFGDGIRRIREKADAILPYRYHLVLENNTTDSFWTEKLADAFLGYSLPLFSGCRDLARWFPEQSYEPISKSKIC